MNDKPHANPHVLVSAQALADELKGPDAVVLDCTSTVVPAADGFAVESGHAAFLDGHIPGAQFVDLERDLSAPADGLLFTLPTAQAFGAAMTKLGVGRASRVVTYSTAQPGWAARVFLMLRAFGFDNAAVLNGGFAAWKNAGLPVAQGEPAPPLPAAEPFPWALRDGVFVATADVEQRGAAALINALGPDAFRGDAPIAYGRPGRIPGSVNVPTASLADPGTGLYKTQGELEALFAAAGVRDTDRVIAYCGAGVAGSNVAFARLLMGAAAPASVYDGSLLEWTKDPARKMDVG
jgi:thiosulfate/3-mercaptopyruvate sulfurtransferase